MAITRAIGSSWIQDLDAVTLSRAFSTDWIQQTSVSGGSVTGSLSVTESGSDTSSIAGAVLVSGSLSATETDGDTVSINGTVSSGITGNLTATESSSDTVSIAGSVAVSGSLSATETDGDTVSITGVIGDSIFGTINATETGVDSASISGTVAVSGNLSATDQPDTAAISGEVAISGDLAATESTNDTTSIVGDVSGATSLTPGDIEAIADAVWSRVIEDLRADEMMRIMLAALAGKREGLGTLEEIYYGVDGVKQRIVFTPTDANGNGDPVIDGSP